MRRTCAIACTFAAMILLPVASTSSATAQRATPQSPSTAKAAVEPKTLKERLSDKASDEQRVDNCKVPVAERGDKIRPDDCSHAGRVEK